MRQTSVRHPNVLRYTILLAGLVFAFAQTAWADTAKPQANDGAFSALVEFAKGLDTGGSSAANASLKTGLVQYAQQTQPPAPAVRAQAPAKQAPAKKAKAMPVKSAPGDDEATFVGSAVCMGCHSALATSFKATLMGRIFLTNPRSPAEKGGCETCHGPGSLHVKAGGGRGVGGIISFRPDDTSRPVADNNAICLGCHERGDRTNWSGSTHQMRDVACTNCHQIMQKVSVRNQLAKGTELETCFQCHKDKRAQIQKLSHMPLIEGKMTCSDCHNPHGSYTEALLREASVNETCYKCHAEKRGPFLWEHPPVRENCLNCHDPHGSNTEYLLTVQRPRLCQQCHMGPGHGNPGNPQAITSIGHACQNCHSQIHGSNAPAGELFQR